MSKNRPYQEQLSALAYHLLRNQATILAQWQARVEARNTQLSMLAKLSLTEFADHIPEFLDHLAGEMSGDRGAEPVQFAIKHGAHRWQHGAKVPVMTQEWRLLQRVLLDHVAAAAETIAGFTPQALREVYGIVSDEILRAIGASISEFSDRQRLEADARLRDLEGVIEERAERNKLFGAELHEVSHDLRGSLQLLQSSYQLLKRRPLDSKAESLMTSMGVAIDNVRQLLHDLVDLARLEAGREERHIAGFDAAKLLRDLCVTMRPAAEAEGLALTEAGADSLRVRGDATKLRRIAQNLILNALKYTPAGKIEVGWKSESDDRWLFYVHDTGPGLPQSTAGVLAQSLEEAGDDEADKAPAPHLDDLSPQSDKSRPTDSEESPRVERHGEGIGLAIVRQLCELLGAVIEVESAPGRGALFRVLLPTDYPESR